MNNKNEHTPSRRQPLPARLLLVSVLTAAFILVGGAHAATYYVKNGGNDSAAGSTDGSAWATIARVNNGPLNDGGSYAAGDIIYFKRGSTWSGTGLTVNSSGSAGSPITYTAYGTGNKPVISGGSAAGITISNRNHVEISDLALLNNGTQGISLVNANHINILRVDVTSNQSGPGINAVQGGNVVIDGCVVTGADNNGIQFKGSVTNPIHDSVIQNCTVTNTLGNDGIVIHPGPTTADEAGANFIIRNNYSEGSYENGYDITTGSNILLEGNVSRLNRIGAFNIGHSATNVTVRYHSAENEPTVNSAQTVKITVPNVTVEYCTLVGSATSTKPVINIVNGTAGEPVPENVVIRNNTVIWNNASAGGNFFSIGAGVAMANLTLKNNIFASRTSQGGIMNFAGVNAPNSAGFQIDNNLYYGSTATRWNLPAGSNKTFAEYRSLYSQDDNGVEGSPLFVDAGAGDFHLQSSSSPAYNAGQNVGIAADFDGVAVPQGGARDIGAFELPVASQPAAPSGLTASAASGSQINLSWTDNASNETGFEVDRALNSGFSSGLVTNAYTTGANPGMPVAAGGLTANTTYYFRVRATNAAGDSANSNTASATTLGSLVLEAEDLTVASNSDSLQVVTDSGASAGEFHLMNANADGDQITYTVNIPTAGTYQVITGLAKQGNRGIFQLKIDGTNQGSAQDYYEAGSTPQFEERNLGTVSLSAGNHSFRFECTGKNASASNRKHGLDFIRLVP